MTQVLDVPDEAEQQQPGGKPLKFPTAFTVLGAVLLVVWVLSFVIPSGTYEIDPETGGPMPGTLHRGSTPTSRFPHQFYKLWNAPTNGLYGIENEAGNVSVDQLRVPLRVGDDLPVRPRDRRVRQRDDEDRGDPDRHRPARAALPAQRLVLVDRADERLRARRDHLRDVGGDARASSRCSSRWSWRSASTAWSRASIIFLGAGSGRARLDREPVRHRRRVRRRGHRRRRRHRACASRCSWSSSAWRSATCCCYCRTDRAAIPSRSIVGISAGRRRGGSTSRGRGRAGAHRPPEVRSSACSSRPSR